MDCGSLISGGAIAIFAFCLAWARDSYARRRERARHDQAVIGAIRAETFANRATLENNQRLVERELELLPKNERLLNPLDPLQAGFWDLVKVDPPRILESDDWPLSHVRTVARLTEQVNEMLRSRENFRVLSPTLTMHDGQGQPSWKKPLEGYDILLKRFQGELLEAIDNLESTLDAYDTT